MKKILNKLVIFSIILLNTFSFNNTTYAWSWEDFTDDFAGIVYIESEILDDDILRISIKAQDMTTPILGFAFHLDYPNQNLTFLKYTPGDFLERGGDPFYLVSDEEEKSKIIFGETLRREDSFPVGDGLITEIYFQIKDENNMYFNFENAVASTLDEVRQDIDRINWKNLNLNTDNDKLINFDKVNTNTSSSFQSKNINKITENKLLLSILILSILSGIMLFFILKQSKNKTI